MQKETCYLNRPKNQKESGKIMREGLNSLESKSLAAVTGGHRDFRESETPGVCVGGRG